MVTGAQLLGTILMTALLFYAYLQYRRKNISGKALTLWGAIWILIGVVFIVPQQFYPLMTSLNIERTADFVLSIGVILSLAGTFILHIRLSRLTKRMEKLVESIALTEED